MAVANAMSMVQGKEFLDGGFDVTDNEENFCEQTDEITALQSIYEDTERVTILEKAGNDDASLNSLQVSVPPKMDGQRMQVEIWLPVDDEQVSMTNTSPQRKNFLRSPSGQKWTMSFDLQHLCPLTLQITLPPDYPSKMSPIFTLSALWLNPGQLSAICRQLDEVWAENSGIPIIYTWIDWIENNVLRFLGIEDHIILCPYLDEDSHRDPRALPECTNVFRSLDVLCNYDSWREGELFAASVQQCDVCYDERPGNKFYRLAECRHHFCKDCFSEIVNLHVTEGTVQEIICPQTECDTVIPPRIIQDVLEPQDFERWERLMLQRTLDLMRDVVYCPRCNSAVIQEEEEALSLARCPVCMYAFCTECESAWHQGEPCFTNETDIEENSKAASKGTLPLNAPKKRRQERIIRNDAVYVKTVSKKCPGCGVPIQKADGCNKVTCSLCRKSMCWLCGKAISNYEHFNTSNCQLFTANAYDANIRERVPQQPVMRLEFDRNQAVAQENIIPCIRCRQRNLKQHRNNHIKCWWCKINFCFHCKQRIECGVSKHFIPHGICQQHS